MTTFYPPAPNQAARFVPLSGAGPLPPPAPSQVAPLVELVRESRRLLAEAGDGPEPLRCACQRAAGPGEQFCAGCGARLRFPCPRCERPCHAGQTYCPGCGVELTAGLVGEQLEALAGAEEEARRRRDEDLLRHYRRVEVQREHPVRHVVGTREDGGREFVKVATAPAGLRLLRNEVAMLERLAGVEGVVGLRERRELSDGGLLAVFEHVESHPLRFPVAIPRLLELTAALLRILEAVHGRGVVHADIKPKHVLLRGDGAPALIDWNIAQEPGPSRFGAYTPLFAAPEQIAGDHVDARCDLFAVGVMLYLLFTHDRFPAVLEETAESERVLEVLQAKKAMNRAYLTMNTNYVGSLAKFGAMQQMARQAVAEPPADLRRVLGAKYLFASELRRTRDVNLEIRWTADVLQIVRRATAIEPTARYPDAAAMRAAVEAVLARREER